ncbi:MAG: sialate O-acetylesterase, partial [Treponema sp.]|nr:sialate O-acetylesterase [Treponema sp.]
DEYAKKFGVKAGLIPCADGGSSLDEWAAGGQLYSHALALTRLAQQVSEVKAILWHQGEAESGSEEKARTYKTRFLNMLSSLRKECSLEDIPVILGELGNFLGDCAEETLQYYPLVNKALAEIAAPDSGIGLASAEGLGANSDNLHFNAESCRIFGGRYFQKYLELSGAAGK